MAATEDFLKLAEPDALELYRPFLAGPSDPSTPGWAARQLHFLEALDRYVDTELERPPNFEIASHEAGGQCRIWFPHYRVRGRSDMLERMRAIMEARRAWVCGNLFHGYVDCHEVHHEPETFLYFQVPLMHLTGDRATVEAVEDFAHHAGNWVDTVPDWYDWDAHGFRSTWVGTREVRGFPPYDYQEGNHFRLVAITLAAHVATGAERYLELAVDYADRWCRHIEHQAAPGGPIPCSILPEGARREDMGHGGASKGEAKEGVYPVFYATVASNTAYDIVTVLLDLYRLTGRDRYRAASEAMIAQFFDNADEAGRPPTLFSSGEWRYGFEPDDADNPLDVTLSGSNQLLVRMAGKYRAITREPRFDREVLKWAGTVCEEDRAQDQIRVAILMEAHRLTGDEAYLERACAMAIRGMAVTEGNRMWHQCDARGRYGFRDMVPDVYHPILAGVDYATRGGLPLVGLSCETDGRLGLPEGAAVRSWEPVPGELHLEAVNSAPAPAVLRLSAEGSRGGLEDAQKSRGEGELEAEEQGWRATLPAGGCLTLRARWTETAG